MFKNSTINEIAPEDSMNLTEHMRAPLLNKIVKKVNFYCFLVFGPEIRLLSCLNSHG